METYLNDDESRIYDLIESKSWAELTPEEQIFASGQMTRDEYTLQRELMLAASEELYADDDYEPLPLNIPAVQSKTFIQRSIPIYQAVAAVAAVILFFLIVRPSGTSETMVLPANPKEHPVQAHAEKEYIHDTVVHYVTIAQKEENTVLDTLRKLMSFPEDQAKQLEATANPPAPELTAEKLETKGTSLKDDNTTNLVPKIVNTLY